MPRETPEDCNSNPSGECIHGNDDHPANIVKCASCGIDYPRWGVTVWVGASYICVDCSAAANRLPFEDD